MARGLLVSFPGIPATPSSLIPDNGLASLASSLLEEGHHVQVMDFSTPDYAKGVISDQNCLHLQKLYEGFSGDSQTHLNNLLGFLQLARLNRKIEKAKRLYVDEIAHQISDHVKKNKIDFVGIKIWNGDGFEGTKMIAIKLKNDHPRLKLYGGGPHAYSFGTLLFKYIPLDAICYDEGEYTIKGLASFSQGIGSVKDIPNLYYRKNDEIRETPLEKITRLDDLPVPVYSPDVYLNIEAKMKIYVIDETRGCKFSCPFCVQSSRKSNQFRTKSARRILDEMHNLILKHKAKYFRFGGQMTPGNLLEQIAQQILSSGYDIRYTCFGHINSMKDTDFPLLRKSGLISLFFGIESGSQTILDKAFHKTTKPEDIAKTLIAAKESGIKTVASMIFPAPFETEETRKETMKLLEETHPDSVLAYFAGLYPNTTWHRNLDRYGFEVLVDNYTDRVANYKVSSIFPPKLWKPLPYRYNGLKYHQFLNQTTRFIKDVEKLGLTTFLTDDHFLVAEASGMDKQALSHGLGKTFFSGDHRMQTALVKSINGTVT